VEQYVPLPNRPLVNFAHSRFLKGWSGEDEGKPPCFLYVMFAPE
jgi:hypothetical protein